MHSAIVWVSNRWQRNHPKEIAVRQSTPPSGRLGSFAQPTLVEQNRGFPGNPSACGVNPSDAAGFDYPFGDADAGDRR